MRAGNDGRFSWAGRALAPVIRLVAAVLACGVLLAAAPEPDPVPRRWQLDVTVGPLRLVKVETEKTGPRAYFVMTYKVVNNSGQDLLFAPLFELVSQSSGKVYRSGRDVPAEVTAKLIEREQNPLLQDQINILGMLLQNEENAREGIVVWPAEELQTEGLALYAAGFSGESRTVELPASQGQSEPQKVTLRKTLMVRYRTSGQLLERGETPLEVLEQRWVMR